MHIPIEPSILYFGTPVILVGTTNEDGSTNLAPMSSAWWAQNLLREKECVLNLPSSALVEKVNRLARLTGSDPVPPHKIAMGYRSEKDKFGVAGLTGAPSNLVKPLRVLECSIQLEAVLETVRPFGTRPDKWRPLIMSFCEFYGLGEKLQVSTLAEIPEASYRPATHMTR